MSDGGFAANAPAEMLIIEDVSDALPRHWASTFDKSCPLCFGSKLGFAGAPCSTCAEPDFARVRWMLPLLSSAQIDFLRAFEHTRADQCISAEEFEQLCRIEFYVEDSDGVYDADTDEELISPTRYWFGSAQLSNSAPGGNWHYFIRYNPVGLHLRRCLMVAANARQTHA